MLRKKWFWAAYWVIAHLLYLHPPLSLCYNQNPKLYVDIDCIQFIDPLLHGFNIHLPAILVNDYLDSHRLPVIYISAIPLKMKSRDKRSNSPKRLLSAAPYDNQLGKDDPQPVRKILYTEEIIDKVVTLNGLQERSWYYVCVEFENMHRRQRHGNTSTTCELQRTLDRFGKKADSTLEDVRLTTVTPYSLEFQLRIITDFPLFLDVYLNAGPSPFQRYFIDGRSNSEADDVEPDKTVRISFNNLSPDTDYGQLCVRQDPLARSYTAMGRTISVQNVERCYLKSLRTAAEPLITEVSAYSQELSETAYVRSSRNAGNGAGFGVNMGPLKTAVVLFTFVSLFC